MFNISKNTIWFVIIFASICCILLIFNSSNSNHCCSSKYKKNNYNRYLSYESSHSSGIIPVIIDYNVDETSETIRKKQNRKHTESKKIFISPKSNVNLISINKIKKQLENKLKNNKNIKKQYENTNTQQNNIEDDDNEPTQNKPTQNKPTQNKPTQNKPTQNKPTQNKPTQNKPTQNKPTIRLFFANWCGACQQFKPIWFELKKIYQNKINFVEIDCTENTPGLNYVQYLPTIAIYDKNDKYIENYEDDRSKYGFKQFLNHITDNI